MRKLVSYLLLVCMMVTMLPVHAVKADSYETTDTPYLALGADLTEKQKATVLDLLGVDAADLADYVVVTVTNDDEHEYLDSYLSDSVIGTKALSSVLITKAEEGEGISVDTHNITYCTATMYCNALITAGIEDANVVVAGPFNLTGTAALVGAIKAYSTMTGTEEVSQESIDAATDELVTTGEVGEEIAEDTGDDEEGKETAGELMALVKSKVVEDNLTSEDDILDAVNDACDEMNLTLSDDSKAKIASVMGKVSKLDLDTSTLKTQAKDLYNKLADLDIDTDGWWAKAKEFCSKVVEKVADFFGGLFN